MAADDHVEHAHPGQHVHPADAFDPPLEGCVEREDVLAVDRQALASELGDDDLLAVVGQVEQALADSGHQRHALAGCPRGSDPSQLWRLRVEVDQTLIGDH